MDSTAGEMLLNLTYEFVNVKEELLDALIKDYLNMKVDAKQLEDYKLEELAYMIKSVIFDSIKEEING